MEVHTLLLTSSGIESKCVLIAYSYVICMAIHHVGDEWVYLYAIVCMAGVEKKGRRKKHRGPLSSPQSPPFFFPFSPLSR